MLAERYELDHEIGRGGMGTVWHGWDTVLDRVVAIKQIGSVAGEAAPDMVRAEREARLAARVTHHNVVAVFDLVDGDDAQWLVMEYVDGPSLSAVIAEHGALDTAAATALLHQTSGALAAAHAHGIVHRDVKPSNVLLTGEGVAKLSDFGVARAEADAALTRTGLVTGSPGYLAPEIATGSTATSASDVWSLGATMFHAVSGHAAYAVNDSVLATMYQIVNEEPPRLTPEGPLAELVTAMMNRDPHARPSMAEIEAATAGDHQALVVGTGLSANTGSTSTEPSPTSAFSPVRHEDDAPVAHRAGPQGRRAAWLAGAAAAAVLAVVAVAVGVTGDGNSPGGTASETVSPGASAPSDPTPDGSAPTGAAALEGFAGDYLTAASNDPEAGFAMLTPAYQKQSGGLSGYQGFWSNVSNLDIESVQGDLETLGVSYRYSYDYDGERRTEDVTLDLQKSGSSYLIAGAG